MKWDGCRLDIRCPYTGDRCERCCRSLHPEAPCSSRQVENVTGLLSHLRGKRFDPVES